MVIILSHGEDKVNDIFTCFNTGDLLCRYIVICNQLCRLMPYTRVYAWGIPMQDSEKQALCVHIYNTKYTVG